MPSPLEHDARPWMLGDTAQPTVTTPPTPLSPPSGPMTRARAKAIHDKVNSFLSMCDLDPTVDGTLPHANALCILRYEPNGGRQVDTGEDGEGQREAEPGTGRTGPGTVPAGPTAGIHPANRLPGRPAGVQPTARQSAVSARRRTEPAPAGSTG